MKPRRGYIVESDKLEIDEESISAMLQNPSLNIGAIGAELAGSAIRQAEPYPHPQVAPPSILCVVTSRSKISKLFFLEYGFNAGEKLHNVAYSSLGQRQPITRI